MAIISITSNPLRQWQLKNTELRLWIALLHFHSALDEEYANGNDYRALIQQKKIILM